MKSVHPFKYLFKKNAYHNVSVQTNVWVWKACRLNNFKMAASLDIRTILSILSHHFTLMSSTTFRLNPTYCWRDGVFFKFQDGKSWISEQNNFSNSASTCCTSSQVSIQYNLWFGRKYHLKNFKTEVILDIGTQRFSTFKCPCWLDACN